MIDCPRAWEVAMFASRMLVFKWYLLNCDHATLLDEIKALRMAGFVFSVTIGRIYSEISNAVSFNCTEY